MVQFFEKRGQMSETIDKIAKGNYGDVRRIVEEEMSKGIGPAKSILSQLWSNLQQTMGKTFEGGAVGKLQWIGDKLLQVNALWNALFNDTGPQDAIDSLRAAGGDALVDLYEKLQGSPTMFRHSPKALKADSWECWAAWAKSTRASTP